jgi:hypothetical protein
MPLILNYTICVTISIFKLRKYDHISTKINELKRVRVENIFQYHLFVFAFKMFLTNQPTYFRRKFKSRRNLHDVKPLSMPKYHTAIFKRSRRRIIQHR